MEGEIEEKLQKYYDFSIEVNFKDYRQYEIMGKINNEKYFKTIVLYDARFTIDGNISSFINIIDKEILKLFRRGVL